MHLLERATTDEEAMPCFDVCLFDGAHLRDTDGFAFFLAEKLVRPDRWILFDDPADFRVFGS